MQVIVMAKEPVPGRVKTRLCPPCTPEEAAAIAAAAIADTLDAALGSGAEEVVLALDGDVGDWCPAGVRVVAQGTGSFAERLTTAWNAVTGPAVQIGMDTPQVTADILDAAMAQLVAPGTDAVLGPAADGGWWLLGLHHPDGRVFDGVPMSRADTGDRQLGRLRSLGLEVTTIEELVDVDTFVDAVTVAGASPATRFARRVGELSAVSK